MTTNESFPKFDLPVDFIADDSITGDILNYYGNFPCKIKAGVFVLCTEGMVRATINLLEIVIRKNDFIVVLPNSFIQIMKFESKGDKRRCVIAKSNTFGGAQSGADDLVSFQAKKYGETAYILNIPSTPGEYGVMVTNPNSLTEKNMTVYCYTIK